MRSQTQRQLVLILLAGMFVCARAVESRSLALTQITSDISCVSVHAVETDFDENGVSDRVTAVDEGDHDALSLVLNQSEPIVLGNTPACELSALDFDRDHDVDLLALDSRGDLLIWQNEDGKLRRLEPRHASRHDVARASLHPALPAHRGAVYAGGAAGILDRRRHALALAVDRHHTVRTRVAHALTLKACWRARPPPSTPLFL